MAPVTGWQRKTGHFGEFIEFGRSWSGRHHISKNSCSALPKQDRSMGFGANEGYLLPGDGVKGHREQNLQMWERAQKET